MACVCSKIGTRDFRTRSKSAKVAQHTLLGVMVSNKCNSNMWTNQETLTAVCTRAVCMRHHGELSNCNCSKPDKRWLIYIYWEHLREHSACFIEHSFMYDYSRFPCKLNGESLFFLLFRSILSFSARLSPFPFLPYDSQWRSTFQYQMAQLRTQSCHLAALLIESCNERDWSSCHLAALLVEPQNVHD